MAKDFSYLDNGTVKIGVITDWGCSIGYFSRSGSNPNFINSLDKGREVQQSYYGNNPDNSYDPEVYTENPNWPDWPWNPVQAGDSYGNLSELVDFSNDGTTIYSKTIPKNWALDGAAIDGYMEQWITLNGAVAEIRFKFTYTGTISQQVATQEVPAAFFNHSQVQRFVTYKGAAPWTDGTLSYKYPKLTGYSPDSCLSPELWSAYINDGLGAGADRTDDSWADGPDLNASGVGLFAHIETTEVTPPATNTGMYVTASGGDDGYVSYFSHQIRRSFSQDEYCEYTCYLMLGTLAEMRASFYALAGAPVTTTSISSGSYSADTTITLTNQSGGGIQYGWGSLEPVTPIEYAGPLMIQTETLWYRGYNTVGGILVYESWKSKTYIVASSAFIGPGGVPLEIRGIGGVPLQINILT